MVNRRHYEKDVKRAIVKLLNIYIVQIRLGLVSERISSTCGRQKYSRYHFFVQADPSNCCVLLTKVAYEHPKVRELLVSISSQFQIFTIGEWVSGSLRVAQMAVSLEADLPLACRKPASASSRATKPVRLPRVSAFLLSSHRSNNLRHHYSRFNSFFLPLHSHITNAPAITFFFKFFRHTFPHLHITIP